MIKKKSFNGRGQDIYSVKYSAADSVLKTKIESAVKLFSSIKNPRHELKHLALYLSCFGKTIIRECEPCECYFKNLRNKFIMVDNIIIDTAFKDHFQICRPTNRYLLFYNRLPSVFVGTESDLRARVDFFSQQIFLSFYDNDLVLPPWRRKPAILSKWFPIRYNDYDFSEKEYK